MTTRTLIEDVLQDIGVLGSGDYLAPEDANYVLRLINQWLGLLALQPLTMYYMPRTTKVLASGTASYTIGTGGDIPIVRPNKIVRAGIIINNAADPTTEIPIDVFTDQVWDSLAQKSLRNPLAQGIYYDRNWTAGLGRIYPWPVPNVGTTSLVLYTLQALTTIASLDTDLSYPPGYEFFLRTQARQLAAGGFGKMLKPEHVKQLNDANKWIKVSNIQPVEVRLDPATPGLVSGAGFDINTGDVHRNG